MSVALSKIESFLPRVRSLAYSVRAIRGVRIHADVVQSCLREAEKNGDWETFFHLRKEFDPTTGRIYFPSLISSQRAQNRQLFEVPLPADLDQEAIAHTHPFGDPTNNARPSIIDYGQIRQHQEGIATSAILIFGGGQGKGWQLGAWTYDETMVNEPYPTDHQEAEKHIYSLPLKVGGRERENQRLLVALMEAIRGAIVVGIDNSHPYPLAANDPADVSDIIALRKWLIAAELLRSMSQSAPLGSSPLFRVLEAGVASGKVIRPENADQLWRELIGILIDSERPTFEGLLHQATSSV